MDYILSKLAIKQTVSFEIVLYRLSYTWTTPVSQPTVAPAVVSDMHAQNGPGIRTPSAVQEVAVLPCRGQEYLSCMNDLVSEPPSPRQNRISSSECDRQYAPYYWRIEMMSVFAEHTGIWQIQGYTTQ